MMLKDEMRKSGASETRVFKSWLLSLFIEVPKVHKDFGAENKHMTWV